MSGFAAGPLEKSVTPFESSSLPILPDEATINDGLRALAVGCSGSVFHGPALEAQVATVKLLRARPDIAAAFGLAVNELVAG